VSELTPGEWAALGLVADHPVHGYDVARELSTAGSLGAVWTVSRPLVYRALAQLEAQGYVRPAAAEPSDRGPNRVVLEATRAGRRAFERWLHEPVAHIRDVRSVLLLKLALLDRRGDDPAALLDSQRAIVAQLVENLLARRRRATEFDRVLLTWRVESARAVLRFIDAVVKG
jgi:PadR family transcriptional regulator AphA